MVHSFWVEAKSECVQVDLLDDIFDRQSSLLQNRPLTVDEAELERVCKDFLLLLPITHDF